MDRSTVRGKRADTGEWIYGAYLPPGTYNRAKIITHYVGEDEVGRVWVHARDIMPGTVGYFSGMFDDSGTPIFEDDVLEIEGRSAIGDVIAEKGACVFVNGVGGVIIEDTVGRERGWLFGELFCKKLKVVGNTFDGKKGSRDG